MNDCMHDSNCLLEVHVLGHGLHCLVLVIDDLVFASRSQAKLS